MTFLIRQNATLPVLKMQLVEDGRNQFQRFHEMLENSAITFSMINTETGIYKIANREATFALRSKLTHPDEDDYYYILYKWQEGDTDMTGTYRGEFRINFYGKSCGELINPLGEDLTIIIKDSLF